MRCDDPCIRLSLRISSFCRARIWFLCVLIRDGPVKQDYDHESWDVMRHANQVVKDIRLPAMSLGSVLMPDDSKDLKMWQADHKQTLEKDKDLAGGGAVVIAAPAP